MEKLIENMEINIHLVANQLFYAPLLLAAGDVNNNDREIRPSDLKRCKGKHPIIKLIDEINDNKFKEYYNYDLDVTDKLNKKGIIPLMFDKEFENSLKANDINLFLTGGVELDDYVKSPDGTKRQLNDDIVLWHVLVNRLPIIPVHYRDNPTSFNDATKVGCFHDKTTLWRYIMELILKDDSKYLKLEAKDAEEKPIPFTETVELLDQENGCNYAFTTGLFKFKNNHKIDTSFNLPSDAIAFTCIYGYKKDYDNPIKRSYLKMFFEYVELYSESLYSQNYFRRTDLFDKDIMYLIGLLYNKELRENYSDLSKAKQDIKEQLEYYAQNRIWYFQVTTGSIMDQGILPTLFSESNLAYAPIKIEQDKDEALLKLAKKSAIAAVMSRNMSHNYGSHSLVYLGDEKNLKDRKFKKKMQLKLTNEFNSLIKLF